MKKVKNHHPLHSKFTCFHPFLRSLLTPKNRGKKIKKRGGTGEAAAEVGYNTEKSDKEKNSLILLLYGPPSTGKTLRANAVANHTTASFITVVGSEFVQKYLGEETMDWNRVRKWFVMFFDLQKDNSPAIIFIDEVDSIATARFDAETGAARELQRILIELLNEMDRFEHAFDVKFLIVPIVDRKGALLQFRTAEMNLSDEVDLEDYVSRPDKVSAAEIAAICQERYACNKKIAMLYCTRISRRVTDPI
ncbi:UNVERIFIED_CONTAM: 26S proteasome regulatory subunitB [Sesamum radiatum]|uniref:26S proteasome regulatory subunitB n=1 Tax=Sesamum radiatum TaxID=300843 RepID=A0AAW2MDD7_SESRA